MNERPVVVNPDALSKKLLIKRFEESTSDENGFTYIYMEYFQKDSAEQNLKP